MKVVVIADDLTGAAELATAAANLGHRCEVQTHFDPTANADVIALDTNTRSLLADAAAQVVLEATREICRASPDWIFKKTDSVLRGNVRAEVEAVMSAAGFASALLTCANPSKDRVIRNGVYYIDGVPLAQTAFAADPWHPRRSSNVVELLVETGSLPIAQSSKPDEAFVGIAIPDIEDIDAVRQHAGDLTPKMLPAGGVDFFSALLEARLGGNVRDTMADSLTLSRPVLFVCGSHAAWQQGGHLQCQRGDIPVLQMPHSICSSTDPQASEDWSQEIERSLFGAGCAMAAIGSITENGRQSQPAALTERFVEAVALLLRRRPPGTICVEGGATAAALFSRMQWARLQALPAGHLPGVSILKPSAPHAPIALIKPGSYPWPVTLWRSLQA